jgi:hypothetical protein
MGNLVKSRLTDADSSHFITRESRRPQTRRSEQSTSAFTPGAPRRPETDRIETSVECVAERHAVQGRSLVSGRTVQTNLNCYRTVNSRFRAVFGIGVFTKIRR